MNMTIGETGMKAKMPRSKMGTFVLCKDCFRYSSMDCNSENKGEAVICSGYGRLLNNENKSQSH